MADNKNNKKENNMNPNEVIEIIMTSQRIQFLANLIQMEVEIKKRKWANVTTTQEV
jgi:hypothetical protein